jgi:hypothetical protein
MLRLAEKKDLYECMRMAKNFHSASPYSREAFSEEKCYDLFQNYLSGDKTSMIIILAEDTSPFGMIIGIKSELPFSRSVVCTELAWWVDEDKRKTRDSLLLFKAYEDWSRRVGGNLSAVAMLEGVTDLSSFYERSGYSPAEKTYLKEI